MIVSAHRPYFAPFPAFFAKASRSDVFVLMDTVQFPRGTTWLTRNRFKNDQGTLWLTLPVWKKGLGLQQINEVTLCQEGRWAGKHLSSLKAAYRKAPFFSEHEGFLEGIYRGEAVKLMDINLQVIRYLFEEFRIQARLVLLSELGIREKEPLLSLAVCRHLAATRLLATRGAERFLDEKRFRDEGIEFVPFSPKPLVYPQLWGPFIANLSALDLLFCCGPKAGEIIAGSARSHS
jgi:hypothetical protein